MAVDAELGGGGEGRRKRRRLQRAADPVAAAATRHRAATVRRQDLRGPIAARRFTTEVRRTAIRATATVRIPATAIVPTMATATATATVRALRALNRLRLRLSVCLRLLQGTATPITTPTPHPRLALTSGAGIRGVRRGQDPGRGAQHRGLRRRHLRRGGRPITTASSSASASSPARPRGQTTRRTPGDLRRQRRGRGRRSPSTPTAR